MTTREIYYLEECYRDADNRDAYRPVQGGVFYARREDAEAALAPIVAQERERHEAGEDAANRAHQRRRAEHNVLVAAGLRDEVEWGPRVRYPFSSAFDVAGAELRGEAT